MNGTMSTSKSMNFFENKFLISSCGAQDQGIKIARKELALTPRFEKLHNLSCSNVGILYLSFLG